MYSFGDILIIDFPFSDQSTSKRRPAFVIKDTNDKDILIAKVTSQVYNSAFDVFLQDWKQAGLLSSSIIRTHKIQTVNTPLIFGQIGRLTSTDLNYVKQVLKFLVVTL